MPDFSVIIPSVFQPGSRRERIAGFCAARWEQQYPHAQIVLAGNEPFTRGGARNRGAQLANHDILVFADADTIVNKEYMDEAFRYLDRCGSWGYPFRVYYNLNEARTAEIIGLARAVELPRPEVTQCEWALASPGGIFLIHKEDFFRMGGYNEQYKAWGYEDNAFQFAADTLVGDHWTVPMGWVAHLWHEAPDNERFGNPEIVKNRSLYHQYSRARWNLEAMKRLQGV